MQKRKTIPEEVRKIWDEYEAHLHLRDLYIKLPMGFRKARKCAIQAVRKRRLFWEKITEIFPEARGEVTFHQYQGTVEFETEQKED